MEVNTQDRDGDFSVGTGWTEIAAAGDTFRGKTYEEWLSHAYKIGSQFQYVVPNFVTLSEPARASGARHTILGLCPKCNSFSVQDLRNSWGIKIVGNDSGALSPDIESWTIKHFEKLGWRMGVRKSKISCPICVAAAKSKEQEKMDDKINGSKSAELARALEHATKQRALTRKVHETIEQYYPVPEKGYAAGGSDEVVSNKTGASLEFVARERDKMFGPASVIDVKSIEIKIANMERVIKECEEKALAAMERADTEIRAARALVADLKERL